MTGALTACVLVKMARDPALPAGLDTSGQPRLAESFAVLEPAARAGLALARQVVGPSGMVLAVSLGGPEVEDILRSTIAMGADSVLRVHNARWAHLSPTDAAQALVAALRALPTGRPDLVLCGDRSIDDGAGLVGPMVARGLGLGWVSAVASVEMEDTGKLRVHRRRERGERLLLEVSLPAVLCLEPVLTPHGPLSTPALIAAAGAPIDVVQAKPSFALAPPVEKQRRNVLPVSVPENGLPASQRIWSMFWGGERPREGEVRGLPATEVARQIADLLEGRGLLR